MECIVKIQLKEKAPIKKILNIFKVNKAKERATLISLDNEYFPLNNVLAIPYGMLGEDSQIVMDFIIFKLTETYGVQEPHFMTGELLPCYYINNTQTFLTKSNGLPTYGINMKDFSYLTIEDAIRMRNDKKASHSVGFVESRTMVDGQSVDLRVEVKDALERADFIIYDHLEKK